MINQFNQMKMLLYKPQIEKILNGEIPYPISVEIDPSNLCNFNCDWCFFKNFRKTNRDKLSKETLFKLMKYFSELPTPPSITFTGGGEPLTNTDTFEVLELFGKKIDFGLVTNGGLLRGNATLVAENCKYIRISLNAGNKNQHKLMHGGINYWDDIIRSIKIIIKEKKLQGLDISIGLAFLLQDENISGLEDFLKLSESLKVDYVYIRPVLFNGSEGRKIKAVTIEKATRIINRWKSAPLNFKLFYNAGRCSECISKKKNFKTCLSTPLVSIIGADGEVYLCCQFRGNKKFSIGNVNTDSFGTIWKSERHKEVISSVNISKCPPCRNGVYNQIIEGVFIKDGMHKRFL